MSRSQHSGLMARDSYLAGVDARGVVGEDVAFSRCMAPHAQLEGAHVTRLTAAHAGMPQSNLRDADLPRMNGQASILTRSDFGGAQLQGAFFEEATLNDLGTDPSPNLNGAHLADSHRRGTVLPASSLVGASVGVDGPTAGNARRSARDAVRQAQVSDPTKDLG